MEVIEIDHRFYMPDYGVPTIQLGCGGVMISATTNKEHGAAGVCFMPIENDVIGKGFPEYEGQKVDGIGVSFQILSTSKDSLLVLRDRIDEAIEFFDPPPALKRRDRSA